MNAEKRILFGVDASEFALQAVTAVGGLLAHSKDYGVTLFYGAPDPHLFFYQRLWVWAQKKYGTWKEFAAWKKPTFWSKPKKP
jgi:hypothetical protein